MKSIVPPSISTSVSKYAEKVRPYTHLLFFLVLAVIYGFIIVRINMLSNISISDEAISKEVNRTAAPRIDAYSLGQLRTLNDNSVNVQTLFKQGRTNPFQE